MITSNSKMGNLFSRVMITMVIVFIISICEWAHNDSYETRNAVVVSTFKKATWGQFKMTPLNLIKMAAVRGFKMVAASRFNSAFSPHGFKMAAVRRWRWRPVNMFKTRKTAWVDSRWRPLDHWWSTFVCLTPPTHSRRTILTICSSKSSHFVPCRSKLSRLHGYEATFDQYLRYCNW